MLGRLIIQRLRETWGQPVIIENRPGGALMIGANAVAKSAPDGYTLLLTNDAIDTNLGLARGNPLEAACAVGAIRSLRRLGGSAAPP